jgi:hypothetical protein
MSIVFRLPGTPLTSVDLTLKPFSCRFVIHFSEQPQYGLLKTSMGVSAHIDVGVNNVPRSKE